MIEAFGSGQGLLWVAALEGVEKGRHLEGGAPSPPDCPERR
jgi:hypothetical protein